MNDALARLPLFATDDEIAIAIVGKKRASQWKRGALILLEARGFPRFDALHGGRPVPQIRKWYDLYLGVDKSYVQSAQEYGKEDPSAWTGRRKRQPPDRPQLDLNWRAQSVLIYMVAHPDAQTHIAIPNAGPFTMDQLAKKGAVVAGAPDRDGDITWNVTEAGYEEAKRISKYYGGKP